MGEHLLLNKIESESESSVKFGNLNTVDKVIFGLCYGLFAAAAGLSIVAMIYVIV